MSPILSNILAFILLLYSDSYYPRKVVQEFVDYFDSFIRNLFLPNLKTEIIQILREKGINDDSILNSLNPCFIKYSKVFEPVTSEYRRIKLLRTIGYIDYEKFHISNFFKRTVLNNKILFIPESLYGVQVPLRYSLKAFLEIPGLFTQITQYMNRLKKQTDGVISNIVQAKLWTRKYSKIFKNDFVLPLFIFFDDLEVGNALGSHSGINKFGAVYAMIATLPTYIGSRLSTIIFSTLFHSEVKKRTNNKSLFRELIKELNHLRTEGITLDFNGTKQLVKFQLALILGDNLGLNGILGLVESFQATFCCRICKMSSEQMKCSVKEDKSLLRTKENYEQDSKNPQPDKTGIKESCTFHDVIDFNLTENVTVDLMHDVLEGICLYDMKSLIKVFVDEKKYFTLDMLDALIDKFHYGPTEFSNKPTDIKINRLKDSKLFLNMSASEMLCFVRYFGLMVGHLIPRDDKHYKMYKYLRQIIDIVTAPRITKDCATYLSILIENHNSLYIKLFGALKPKYHYLIHYPRILLQNGPVIHFWAMRCESRHRELKANSQASFNTKNLLVTIANKQVLKMSHNNNSLDCNNPTLFNSQIRVCDSLQSMFCLDNDSEKKNCDFYREVEVDGIQYKIGMFVVVNMEEIEKEFGEITSIVKHEDEVLFSVKVFQEFTFDFHMHAYEVYPSNTNKIINYRNLPVSTPCLSIVTNGTHYIASRYGL